jgi:ribose 5-phosphate isomerase B
MKFKVIKGGKIMIIAVGSDQKNQFTEQVIAKLYEMNIPLKLFGALNDQNSSWADVGLSIGQEVSEQNCHEGIVMCWSGMGVTLAANKVRGVRAVLCKDALSVKQAKEWNHANVLGLSIGFTDQNMIKEILDIWFSTPYGSKDTGYNLNLINKYEQKYEYKS